MRKIGVLLVSVFLLVLGLETSNATVLNFDDLSGWDTVPVNYGGLVWNDSWQSVSEGGEYQALSHPNAVTSFDNMDGISWTGLNYIGFQTPGTFQGAYFSGPADFNNPEFPNTVHYDLSYQGAVVWSTPAVHIRPAPTFVASNYDGLVDTVFVRGSQSYFAMDDFYFNDTAPTAAPVPGAFLLLASGLGGFAVIRSRFRK